MPLRWEGHQRGVCGLVHACAEGPGEELAAIWSRPGDLLLGPNLRRQLGRAEVWPEDTLDHDLGRNIQAMAHAISGTTESCEWLVRLHCLELRRGLEGRDLGPLYSADNLATAISTYWTLDLELRVIRRWIRARLTIAALMAAPYTTTRATWAQPPDGWRSGPGEHWREGVTVVRAGSRVNAQVMGQEAISDLLCAAIEWPGWGDRRLVHRDQDWYMDGYAIAPGKAPPGWQPSYLDPCLAVALLSTRLGVEGVELAVACTLTCSERHVLRGVVRGDPVTAAIAVRDYLGEIPCHPHFGAIHFLRDESSVAVVIERSASRNKPTAAVSMAAWDDDAPRPHLRRCHMTTLCPSVFSGSGATPARSTLTPGHVVTVGDVRYDTAVPRGEIWHYRWTAGGMERVGSGGPVRPLPPPVEPEPPSRPRPPFPSKPVPWWRWLLDRLGI